MFNSKLINIYKIFPSRNFSSALYITGDKAQKNFAVLTPVIEFEKQLENRNELLQNIIARKLPIDLDKVEKRWQFFRSIDDQKSILQITRTEIGRSIAELMKNADENSQEIEKLKLHNKIVKEDLKNLKESYYEIEEGTMIQVLGLPNVLHPKTPRENEVLVHEHLKKPLEKSVSHMDIAKEKNYIKYINPMSCYLKSDAAMFEMSIQSYMRNCLENIGFTQFSSPDFVRSVIVEGCGTDFNSSSKILTIADPHNNKDNELNRLHLSGGGSLYSFMAYFARHYVQQTYFPLKYFSMGRSYRPVEKSCPKDLFNLNQESVLSIFMATHENDDILDSVIEDVIRLYEPFNNHFRLVFLPASKLERAESLRLSIQMYSPYLQSYVEVGNVSSYESYLSKRLLFNYSQNKERKYPNVIAGTILNVHKLLGCFLENNSFNNEPLLCNILIEHSFV